MLIGATTSDMFEIESSKLAEQKGNAQEKFGGMTPLCRPGQPVELASIYVQLAAADASYATGQVYGASGGAGQP